MVQKCLNWMTQLRIKFRELHQTKNWACFEHYLKIVNYFENDLIILKQIVWESLKMTFKV